jgi:glycosyltransferase involved in cell wall biosynthesis
MHVLFIHQAFPAQFGRLALELTNRYGWRCSFLIQSLSGCPTPSEEMLRRLELHKLALPAELCDDTPLPWPQTYNRYLEMCGAVYDAVLAMPDLKPDLVVAHGGRGAPTLFLPELVRCPIINYCEYYFARSHCDLSYRVDLPPAEPARMFPRTINAPTLASLNACDSGYSATHWQRASFPERYRHKIEVHFDGIDVDFYQPRAIPPGRASQLLGRSVPAGTRVVTYVARGLESMRGFDVFMRVAARITRERPDVLFVVVGSEDVYYGWDVLHTGQRSFKQWVLGRGDYDLSRFVFLGQVLPERLAELFSLSDLHFYLSVPFVLSWSLFDALASGCVVLASDVPQVREVITPGVHGLLEPFFDVERLSETALRILADPAAFQPHRTAGRRLVETKYSLEVAVPALQGYFERVANSRRD